MASFSVTDGNGKFLGRDSLTSPLDWTVPAHGYAWEVRETAEAVALAHGGTVVPMPRWNQRTKAWEWDA